MREEGESKNVNILCTAQILTTLVSFDLASPPTNREWKHQKQLPDFPGSLQAHTAPQRGMLG